MAIMQIINLLKAQEEIMKIIDLIKEQDAHEKRFKGLKEEIEKTVSVASSQMKGQ